MAGLGVAAVGAMVVLVAAQVRHATQYLRQNIPSSMEGLRPHGDLLQVMPPPQVLRHVRHHSRLSAVPLDNQFLQGAEMRRKFAKYAPAVFGFVVAVGYQDAIKDLGTWLFPGGNPVIAWIASNAAHICLWSFAAYLLIQLGRWDAAQDRKFVLAKILHKHNSNTVDLLVRNDAMLSNNHAVQLLYVVNAGTGQSYISTTQTMPVDFKVGQSQPARFTLSNKQSRRVRLCTKDTATQSLVLDVHANSILALKNPLPDAYILCIGLCCETTTRYLILLSFDANSIHTRLLTPDEFREYRRKWPRRQQSRPSGWLEQIRGMFA